MFKTIKDQSDLHLLAMLAAMLLIVVFPFLFCNRRCVVSREIFSNLIRQTRHRRCGWRIGMVFVINSVPEIDLSLVPMMGLIGRQSRRF